MVEGESVIGEEKSKLERRRIGKYGIGKGIDFACVINSFCRC